MPEKPQGTLPLFLNLDVAFEKMSPSESPFIKGVEIGISKNPLPITGNPTGEGQNALDLSPVRSNSPIPNAVTPKGYNKNVGSFYSETTRETYYANYNSNLNHGIYVINGDTGVWSQVIIDKNLPFTLNQEDYLADHRWKLRVLYDSDGNIIEKFLMFVNGAGWQGFISVVAAIATNGFDATTNPYWALTQPLYDRRELLEWPVRPTMYNPTVAPLPNLPTDIGKVNRIIDQAFQFAVVRNNTDGRQSAYSPYSQPLIIKSEDFLNNPDILSKKALITMDAGSCMTESIDLMIRFTAPKQIGIPSTSTWGDWMKYIRLYKFSSSTGNPSDVLQTNYWTRTNPWAGLNYDPIQNTIQYVFDNSILPEITDQNNAARIQNDIPIMSMAFTDINDAAAVSNNLYDYDNFDFSTIANLDVEVAEKPSTLCQIPLRKVTLYAVATRPGDRASFESMVGYYVGADTQMRWGGIEASTSSPAIGFDEQQSKNFGLDFADHSAFVCYAKGTPYYVVGQWYLVDGNNNLTPLPALLNFADLDVQQGVNNAFLTNQYYVCVFNFSLPAGRYDFCIGRHNVSLSENFEDTSTYVMGIANSRIRLSVFSGLGSFVTPFSIVKPNTKEIEIDCTNGNVDVWGNGADVFLIFCPFQSKFYFRFIEGYLKESPDNQLGMELFPYSANIGTQYSGTSTDQNGFYFFFVAGPHSVDTAAVEFICKLNCGYPFIFYILSVPNIFGPINNGFGYITDHNGGVVGDCNRVLITGKITDPTGLIPYENISVSIANGSVTTTGSDGTFTLVVHNGRSTLRTDNIYVSAAGNFLITLAGCNPMPLTVYNESAVPCFNCAPRRFPHPINFQVLIQGGTQQSLKENATYQVSIHGADRAGRVTFENVIKSITVPSFLQRNDVLATIFQAFINGSLNIPSGIEWLAFSVSNPVNVSRYFQWVGDSIKFIDNQGNVVDDPSSAVFISIAIDSFYNYAVSKNFSILATYQFSPDDRIRFLDDGNGNLLNSAAFGEGIDLPVLGTNYNQAVQTAGIVPNTNTIPIVNVTNNTSVANTVNTSGTPSTSTTIETTQNNTSITLYVKFDSRLAVLKNNNGFWIEIYTPVQQAQKIPYNELQWYPVINGELAEFDGVVSGTPVFTYPTEIDLPYWDTYLFYRNIAIPNVGDKFLSHPFESPNISDQFGANVTSGGRKLAKNDDARQQWAQADMIKSDAFVGNGILNGIGTFRTENRHNFSQYPFGQILATHTERGIIFVLCENDWFTVNFDFHFTYPNAQGVMIVNLDNDLSTPAQKIGSNFGLHPEDTGTVLFIKKEVQWLDRKNEGWIISDYRDAKDASDMEDETGRKIGVKSYFLKKVRYMCSWNLTADNTTRIDSVAGFDPIRNNVFVTFRPRRNSSNDPRSYVNQRRNIDLKQQETIVYSGSFGRWTRFEGFAPEGYSIVKGNSSGIQFLVFAAGIPYGRGGNVQNQFLNFFGILTEAVWMTNFNQPSDRAKVFQALSFDSNLSAFVDLLFTGQDAVFSYIPVNFFKQKEGIFYSQILRDMYSYPKQGNDNLFRSMLYEGSRISDVYCIVRFVTDPNTLGEYFQVNNLFCTHTKNYPDKK